jgi:NlpC/P60 family putative phage cell wall peptidase
MAEAGTDLTRCAIVAAARDWIGTPYRHQASCKGAGTDCLGLVRGLWREFHGAEPETPPAYTADWAEAPSVDGAVVEAMAEAARRHLIEVGVDEARDGDVVLFRMRGRGPAKHAGILTDEGRMVHAYSGHAVVETTLGPWWRARMAYAFRFPGVTD